MGTHSGLEEGNFPSFLSCFFFVWCGRTHDRSGGVIGLCSALRDSSMKINIIHIDRYNVSKCTLDLMRIVRLRKCPLTFELLLSSNTFILMIS